MARSESQAFNHRPQPEASVPGVGRAPLGYIFCISGCGEQMSWQHDPFVILRFFFLLLFVWKSDTSMRGWGRETKKPPAHSTHSSRKNAQRKFLGVWAMERQTCAKTRRRARRSTGVLAAAAPRGADACSSSLFIWATLAHDGGGVLFPSIWGGKGLDDSLLGG